jgi:sugar phosphate isomerase/epimerase
MKWALATIVLVPRGSWGPPPTRAARIEVFRWAAGAGFAGVELSPRWIDFHGMQDGEIDRLRDDVTSAGLVVSGLCISRCILTRTSRAVEHRRRLERGVEVARRLGAEVLTFSLAMPTLPGPDRPPLRGCDVPEEEFSRSTELVKRLADLARRRDVGLSIELHDDGPLDTPEACLRFLDQVDDPSLGVNPDLGNICRGPGPAADWSAPLELLAPRANGWHVKNYCSGKPVPVWAGDIDYRRAVGTMCSAGFRGWVSIESYFDDVRILQEQSLCFLKRLVQASAPEGP